MKTIAFAKENPKQHPKNKRTFSRKLFSTMSLSLSFSHSILHGRFSSSVYRKIVSSSERHKYRIMFVWMPLVKNVVEKHQKRIARTKKNRETSSSIFHFVSSFLHFFVLCAFFFWFLLLEFFFFFLSHRYFIRAPEC